VDANLEVRTAQKDRSLACASSCGGDGADLSRIGCAIERLHVFKGHVGAYVSYRNNSILQSHLVDFWRTYTNPEMLHLLPAFTTGNRRTSGAQTSRGDRSESCRKVQQAV